MSNQPKCKQCGSTTVAWKQSKAGKWYLAEVRYGARGREINAGPHFKSCPVANAARTAKILADEQAYRAEVREHMVWDAERGQYLDRRTGQPWESRL